MKLASPRFLLLLVVMAACAGRPGSSQSVPKEAIEKAADTKIADAGAKEVAASDAGASSDH